MRDQDPRTLVCDRPLSSFQSVQHVVLPQGLGKIGDSWFVSQDIYSIVIPPSVTDIGPAAFYACEELKSVKFQKGSQLMKIGEHCFGRSGLMEY